MAIAQWIGIAAVVISALAIVSALKSVRDQLRVTVFLAYTERYAKVMNGVPFDARKPGGKYELSLRPEEEQIRVLSAFREYFNLCSEEMWLHQHHRIDQATWSVWERGMKQVARFPTFREAWEILSPEYYKAFQCFVSERLLPETLVSSVAHETDAPGSPLP